MNQPTTVKGLKQIPIAVSLLYLWTFVNIGRPQDIFPWLSNIYPGKVVAALALIAYFLADKATLGSEIRLTALSEFRLILAFVVIAVIATPFGYYPAVSIEFLQDFIIRFGLYLYLVVKLINSRERIVGFIHTITLSGAAMAIAASLSQEAGRRSSVGTMYDPNDLAMLMVTILPISFMSVFIAPNMTQKIVRLVVCVMMLLAIIVTQSRGGFLGLIVVAVTFILVKMHSVSRVKRVVAVAIMAIVFAASMSSDYQGRLATIFDTEEGGAGRTLIWKRATVLIMDHPLLGVGPNAFMTAYGDYLTNNRFQGEISVQEAGGRWQTAHNSYILVATELGLFGFAIFLAINYRSFRNLMVVLRQPMTKEKTFVELYSLALGLGLGLLGFLTCAFFLSQAYNGLVYLICILLGAIRRLTLETHSGDSVACVGAPT